MKRLALSLPLLVTACPPHAAQAPRLEHFVNPPAGRDAALCTADGSWCVTKTADIDGYVISFRNRTITTLRFSGDEPGQTHADLWTEIIRFPRADGGEDVLLGRTNTVQRAYSGGGGQAMQVTLFPLSSTGAATSTPPSVLTFPAEAALDIRACFTPADETARRGACSDQYNFTGTLSLDTSSAPAKLLLTTVATTYPGHLSRNDDNVHTLSADDLKTVRDETCSYRRVFSRSADGIYRPDQPLPPCADYLEP